MAVMDIRIETTKTEAANFSWIRSCLLASVDVNEFQTTDAYSS
jgi:hypothetical protein